MASEYAITTNDCYKILQKVYNSTNFELIEYDEKPLGGEVAGIMGGHYKLKMKLKIDNQTVTRRFFIKRMVSPFDIQTIMIQEQGAYKKELFTYETLSALYEQQPNYKCDYLVKCYLARKNKLFVFKDACEAGFKSLENIIAPLDMDHMKITLKALAKFHAGSIIYENKQSKLTGKPYKLIDEYSEFFKDSIYRKEEPNYLGNKFFTSSVDSVLALIDIVPYFQENKEEIKQKVLKVVEETYDLVKKSDKYYNVVAHGDLWNSNVLFKYENEKPISCVIIDFQAIRYTIPAQDFLYFVRFNCPMENDTCYQQLVKFYYDNLTNCLSDYNIDINNYITFNQFLESLEYIQPFIILQNACMSSLCLLRLYEDLMKDQNEVKKFFYESRTDLCIKAYKENEIFRNVLDPSLKSFLYL